ncbi:MAG: hypothetical protein V7K27_29530 [Nostoc sp.]|uniref:hypothetical protein n=1 Tax=Nostoc sp. TaxID=1180 RepID=UPI002FFBD046
MPEEINSETLLQLIKQLETEMNKLIKFNQALMTRVESLEQFERDFERWQTKIKSHGGFVTGDSL